MLRFPCSSATFREGEWKTSLLGKPCGRMLKFGDGFGDKGNVSSGMYTAGPGVRAHPALAGGQVRCWQRAVPVASHAFLSIQLPSALTGPFFSGNGLRGPRGEGHRGYLSLRSHAAGTPWKAEWSPVDSSERCGGTVQAVACGAVVAAGEGGRAAVLWFQAEMV